ncbi:hypothetical protein C4D60_Mb01t09980 [Musa balbisiana]|uniref:LOB domain-containing protein n=1 Tax=Musa balbisiana TaxID=52838 RepID=A0A4V6T4H0_MUSBA|nr:hypothetical protein C4D60_Mb01t09980 [Musa balbisiana]
MPSTASLRFSLPPPIYFRISPQSICKLELSRFLLADDGVFVGPGPAPRPPPRPHRPSATSSPCAACKFLRRKCQPDCVFAPYFPPDQPQKFVHVHRVFGASNVTKLLNELHPYQREDAVNSLAYEADMRLRDPVHCIASLLSSSSYLFPNFASKYM